MGETPASTGEKGDKLVGRYYVAFDKAFKAEVAEGVARGLEPKDAEAASPIMQEARAMLQRWEDGNAEVVELWRTMNGWVYEGFNATYEDMGVTFDKLYYESDTYLLGKKHVEDGLAKGLFFKRTTARFGWTSPKTASTKAPSSWGRHRRLHDPRHRHGHPAIRRLPRVGPPSLHRGQRAGVPL